MTRPHCVNFLSPHCNDDTSYSVKKEVVVTYMHTLPNKTQISDVFFLTAHHCGFTDCAITGYKKWLCVTIIQFQFVGFTYSMYNERRLEPLSLFLSMPRTDFIVLQWENAGDANVNTSYLKIWSKLCWVTKVTWPANRRGAIYKFHMQESIHRCIYYIAHHVIEYFTFQIHVYCYAYS